MAWRMNPRFADFACGPVHTGGGWQGGGGTHRFIESRAHASDRITRHLGEKLRLVDPQQPAREVPGVEGLHVLRALADADRVDRQAKSLGQRDQDAAAGGAV